MFYKNNGEIKLSLWIHSILIIHVRYCLIVHYVIISLFPSIWRDISAKEAEEKAEKDAEEEVKIKIISIL